MHQPVLAAVLLGPAACLPPQRAAPSVVQQPAPGLAVYDTEVRVDPGAASLQARTTVTFVAGDSTARKVGFLLNRGLQLQEVRGPAVRAHRSGQSEYSPAWNLVEVELDGSVVPGTAVTVQMTYAGTPEFSSDNINGISGDRVELNLDSQWHPVLATFDHQMTGVLRAQLPPGWAVVSGGSVTREDGVHVIRNTVPKVDVAFTAAPSFTRTQSEHFTVHSRQADARTVSAVLKAAESCARYLNAQYGARDRLPRANLVLADRQGPGYGRKDYIVLSEVNPDDRAGVHRFLCHELAHFWTRSAGSFSPHHWMTEAFAEYASARYLREHFGEPAFASLVAQWEAVGRAHGPVWEPASTRRPSFFVMYRRAPYLLSQLEARIGTAAFDRFIAAYMTEGVTTTPQLLEQLEAVAGAEAAEWFSEQLASRPPPAS
ncbi:MAG: hypothetical protein KY467_02075 [Gemmatimonadetes bacterium]|nr:hypothetical protein [Gemmatimonadota bacterium]